jgi:hypothetical protein
MGFLVQSVLSEEPLPRLMIATELGDRVARDGPATWVPGPVGDRLTRA